MQTIDLLQYLRWHHDLQIHYSPNWCPLDPLHYGKQTTGLTSCRTVRIWIRWLLFSVETGLLDPPFTHPPQHDLIIKRLNNCNNKSVKSLIRCAIWYGGGGGVMALRGRQVAIRATWEHSLFNRCLPQVFFLFLSFFFSSWQDSNLINHSCFPPLSPKDPRWYVLSASLLWRF